jgi:peptidoglycan/LPS O-acetylase OafA/YrhL
LDGLRGLLAIVVFFHHFLYAFYPELIFGGSQQEFLNQSSLNIKRIIALSPINILFNPGMAILFFFLLSGYVQTKTYFDSDQLIFLQKSFIKRYFRLAIPTLSVLVIVFIFHQLNLIHNTLFPVNNLSNDWSKNLLTTQLGFFSVVYHGVFECFTFNSRYYQILWTMPLELLNSYIVLILCMVTHQLKNKHWLFIVWLLVQLFFLHSYNGAAFTFGLLFAFSQQHAPKLKQLLSKTAVKYTCLIIGIYFASYPYTGYQNAVLSSIYKPISFFEVYPHLISFLIGVVFLFAALSVSVKFQNLLSGKLFIFFGNISFMFYLIHFLILFSFSPSLYQAVLPHCSFGSTIFITGLLSFVVITLVSFVLYTIVDKPVIRLCNTYAKKIVGV